MTTKPQWLYVGDGRELPITNMLDYDGEETKFPDDAFTLVARLPDGQWLATTCERHEIKPA